jgi:hypothetical protein
MQHYEGYTQKHCRGDIFLSDPSTTHRNDLLLAHTIKKIMKFWAESEKLIVLADTLGIDFARPDWSQVEIVLDELIQITNEKAFPVLFSVRKQELVSHLTELSEQIYKLESKVVWSHIRKIELEKLV